MLRSPPPAATVVGVTPARIGGALGGRGWWLNARLVRALPLYRSRSTHPAMPATEPQLLYCQNVQPCPPHELPGILGLDVDQWATQRTAYPWSANIDVSPMAFAQKLGLV